MWRMDKLCIMILVPSASTPNEQVIISIWRANQAMSYLNQSRRNIFMKSFKG